MPWSSGTFSRIFGAVGWTDDKNSAVKILSSRHDTHDQDLSDGINACITRDNQAKPTASFLPATDNTINLGSGAFRWAALNGVTWTDFARQSLANIFTTANTFGNAEFLTAEISPAALPSGNTIDYAPASFSSARVLRITPNSAGSNLTGLAGGAAGRVVTIINVSASFVLNIIGESAASIAANRFGLSSNNTISAGFGATFWYDTTSSRWRIMF